MQEPFRTRLFASVLQTKSSRLHLFCPGPSPDEPGSADGKALPAGWARLRTVPEFPLTLVIRGWGRGNREFLPASVIRRTGAGYGAAVARKRVQRSRVPSCVGNLRSYCGSRSLPLKQVCSYAVVAAGSSARESALVVQAAY